MSDFRFDSYCGIYCGACSILTAFRTGRKDSFARYWTEDRLKAVLKERGMAISEGEPLELKCHGCKTDTLFINCRDCKIRECATQRKVDCCCDCPEYPCRLLLESVLNKDFHDRLPHLKRVAEDLRFIKENGAERWLEEQTRRWRCPRCQTPASWYATHCAECGADLALIEGKPFYSE